jgi:hypothetical protein
MEEILTSETSVYSNETTRRYIPVVYNHYTRRNENLKCFLIIYLDELQLQMFNIVSGYGLDDRVIEIRSPAEAKGFFL